ncbi:unnamed protein product [Parascedosporium putredinis]|uniref:Apses-domain-containing protein n=1 Tax=Parascedosporium putredinis TaxID=1442378 RepID=A0A9P1H411_9PEZI|nr:unnamed protein product [Parascedosporium putredinis]CAI7995608.1 unnamed protein product [Parascedosporium putredinis]
MSAGQAPPLRPYANGLTSPPTAPPVTGNMGASGLLPPPPAPLPGIPGQAAAMQNQYTGFDTTGQIAPPGMKPRVTATLWEDEGSLCYQVEARGICVARREDNHMINGTKLLNVAGMTRGRRDGILKSEKVRHVVKIGPMHLKGVWIPFERALDFANKEKITELLYPLFVHNIGALLYHPTNQTRTSQVMAAAERRKQEQSQLRAPQPNPSGLPSIQQHHHAMALPGPQPPAFANYVEAYLGACSHVPHPSDQRFKPTTPPGTSMQTMQPPTGSVSANEQADNKGPNGILSSDQNGQGVSHGTGEEEHEHDHEAEYTHDSGYDANRASYNYPAPAVGTMSGDHSHIAPDMTGSPNHHAPASGRATPRSAAQPQSYYPQPTGYTSPPRVPSASNNVYNVMNNDPRHGAPMANGYGSQQPVMNGGSGSLKRGREDDDLPRPSSGGPGMGGLDLKRRKTMIESSVPAPAYDAMNRPSSAISAQRRRPNYDGSPDFYETWKVGYRAYYDRNTVDLAMAMDQTRRDGTGIHQESRTAPAPESAPHIFDPWNSSSTGHQRAETPSAGTGWRDSRNAKLTVQYGGGRGGGGNARMSDRVGRGSEDFVEGMGAVVPQAVRRRAEVSVADMLARPGTMRATLPGPKIPHGEKEAAVAEGRRWREMMTEEERLALDRKEEDDRAHGERAARKRGIFDGIVVYVNGSTHPLISDHRLKQVVVENGGRISLHLGRRQVTHVILGRPATVGKGAGGGLAAGKMEREIRRVGGCGIKYVGVEWVLGSLKAGVRLSEARFSNLKIAQSGQQSVFGLYTKPNKTTDKA